jgi:hypothetical protein
MSLVSDLSELGSSHPDLRSRLGDAATLEDFIKAFRDRLADLEIVIQDEFSRDVLLPVSDGEYLVLSAG